MANLLSRITGKITREVYKRKGAYEDFSEGMKVFEETSITPPKAYSALINLYCSTNGEFNEQEHKKIATKNPPHPVSSPLSGVVSIFDQAKFKKFNDTLNRDGYAFFEEKLPGRIVANIYRFASINGARIPPKYDSKVIYDPANPKAEIYRFDVNDLANNQDIQALMMDPVFINIARNYLGCEPIFDFPAMWWSTTFLKEASVEAAQLYHFDMDRIKWLKIFIYLTDVTPETGPHRYIRGSHQPGKKPAKILKRGYARIPDADLKGYYPEEDFKVICAPAGTIFAGDTKCWHKGTALKKDKRLVLEFQYTSSMFGSKYTRLEINNALPAFKNFCAKNPVYSSNIKILS